MSQVVIELLMRQDFESSRSRAQLLLAHPLFSMHVRGAKWTLAIFFEAAETSASILKGAGTGNFAEAVPTSVDTWKLRSYRASLG